MVKETGTFQVKSGLAQMLKGGVIVDVVTAEHARIAEDAGACSVMALVLIKIVQGEGNGTAPAGERDSLLERSVAVGN